MKILEKYLAAVADIKEEALRFWNWKQKEKKRKLGVQETITEKISVTEIADFGKIELSQIDFPFQGVLPKQRKIKNASFIKCIFSQRTIENYTFSGCLFEECSFNGARIVDAEFHKCLFLECSFYKTKFHSTYLDPASLKFSSRWHWDLANVNSWLFQALYRNSKEMHQEVFAMRADKRFQFYRRYEYLRGQKPKPRKFISSMIFDYLLGYGYGIKNALIVTIVMIVGFAWLIQDYFKDGGTSFSKALYFSVVSFTTVGYGDVTPTYGALPISITIVFLLISLAWCAVVTAIIVKRIVK